MKLYVTTHSGESQGEIEVDSYDPVELNNQINDNQLQSIVIGNKIFSRIDIRNIEPLE
ncbi:hypothetical protein SAMN05216232_2001 [Virgibacillus subterraneus]|uniref:Uncharacterized protein n=1 Tax=Virgibacillus subterraneus TaxID=621109 RepID=A0A1H9EG94_9BACI|nr:hypothetical protein [Virgibacillus subterraneus]SEQ24048.1 hypothetical protein SAMN05216232_2001 [Virgibacillus subterraneus]